MTKRCPKRVALNPDEYAARFIGKTADGRQFFLTTPFVPASAGDPGREFLALYLFDADGRLIEARITDLGPRASLDPARAKSLHKEWLSSLGATTTYRIVVRPFTVQRFGIAFGLVPAPPEEPGEDWQVTAEPGNYMAFSPPWLSGEYDT